VKSAHIRRLLDGHLHDSYIGIAGFYSLIYMGRGDALSYKLITDRLEPTASNHYPQKSHTLIRANRYHVHQIKATCLFSHTIFSRRASPHRELRKPRFLRTGFFLMPSSEPADAPKTCPSICGRLEVALRLRDLGADTRGNVAPTDTHCLQVFRGQLAVHVIPADKALRLRAMKRSLDRVRLFFELGAADLAAAFVKDLLR